MWRMRVMHLAERNPRKGHNRNSEVKVHYNKVKEKSSVGDGAVFSKDIQKLWWRFPIVDLLSSTFLEHSLLLLVQTNISVFDSTCLYLPCCPIFPYFSLLNWKILCCQTLHLCILCMLSWNSVSLSLALVLSKPQLNSAPANGRAVVRGSQMNHELHRQRHLLRSSWGFAVSAS